MCERCNPLGLPQPASSQVHGTVFLAIGVAVVGLAILAKMTLSGVGPMVGDIVSVIPDPPGLDVTIKVSNGGTRAGTATCHLIDVFAGIGPETPVIQTGQIGAGATVSIAQHITEYGSQVRQLDVQCTAP